MVSLVTEEAAGSTSEDIPSDQRIAKLQQQINRQFAIDDYKGAVSACEELCALMSAKYDELHDECAAPYYQYATALLELAREENQVLGTQNIPDEGQEDEGQEDEGQEDEGEEEEETPDSTAGQGPSGTAAGDGEEGEDAAPDDDISSIQIAWEVLELSRVIYARQNSPESQKKLAKVKIKLGEVFMENEKLDEAIIQFSESIEHFITGGEQPDSREISSTYYMMGLAASLDQKYEKAVQFFSKCSELMALQIAQHTVSETASLLDMKSEVDKMVTDCKDSLRQLEQYRKLIPSQITPAGCDSSSTATPNNTPSSSSVLLGTTYGASSSATSSSATSSSATSTIATSTANLAMSNAGFGSASSSTGVGTSTSSGIGTSSSSGIGTSSSSGIGTSSSSGFGTTSSSGFGTSSNSGFGTSSSSGFGTSSSPGFGTSSSSGSSAPVSNITHLVRKRPVSQPVQPVSQTTPSSSSEISAKLSAKPMIRVSPMVSSSTSPTLQTNRQTNRQSAAASGTNRQNSAASSSDISSTNSSTHANFNPPVNPLVQSSSEAQPLPSQAVRPSSSVNRHTNGVSSTSGLDARLSGSTGGFQGHLAGSHNEPVSRLTSIGSEAEGRFAAGNSEAEGRLAGSSTSRIDVRSTITSRQVATVSSVQRTEEAISSSSDFKRPAEEVEDMTSNEAKRSKQ